MSDRATVVRAAPQDAHELAPLLRKEDLWDLAPFGVTPLDALMNGYSNGECFSVRTGDSTIAMFGVSPHPENEDVGVVWLLGSPEIERIAHQFLRQSRSWLEQMSHPYTILTNVCDERNTLHLKWLKWLGFEISAPFDYNGHSLVSFHKEIA